MGYGLVQISFFHTIVFQIWISPYPKSGLAKTILRKKIKSRLDFLRMFFNIWTSPDFRYGLLQILIFTLKFFKYGIVHIINLDLLKPYPEKRLNPDFRYELSGKDQV